MIETKESTDFEKNWFEYEINFPCVLIADGNAMAIVHYSEDSIAYDARGHKYYLTNTNWRRATKEELKILKN